MKQTFWDVLFGMALGSALTASLIFLHQSTQDAKRFEQGCAQLGGTAIQGKCLQLKELK